MVSPSCSPTSRNTYWGREGALELGRWAFNPSVAIYGLSSQLPGLLSLYIRGQEVITMSAAVLA